MQIFGTWGANIQVLAGVFSRALDVPSSIRVLRKARSGKANLIGQLRHLCGGGFAWAGASGAARGMPLYL
jgi:hypothetical protein